MRDEVLELTKRLVAIESVNPDLVPGGAGEGAISEFVAGWLERAGFDVEREEVAPGRWNVVAVARGSGGGRSLMLNAHMDTVGAGGMDAPFQPRLDGGRLHGRGAYDMKASLAAIMVAAARARAEELRGDVVVTAVADEEVASVGSTAVAASRAADTAIVAEPTGERVAVAHRGFVWLEVEVHGRAAHGSRPDLGIDAIAKTGRVLTGLEELDRRLRAQPAAGLVGSGSVHASLIEGGTELSTYPDRCLVKLERRTIPGETPESVEREVRELVGRAAAADPDVSADVRVTFAREPFAVDAGEDVVGAVRRAAAAVGGAEPEVVGVPFWTDAAVLAGAEIPTVLFGPNGEGAHAAVEWVEVDSAARCADVYLRVARDICG